MKPPCPTRTKEGFERRQVIFWFTVLTVLAGTGAYLKMMTGFYLHDDEGSLMIGVKQYLAGMKLYDQVFSVYGPVYYFYQSALRTATATPVTHDVVRISALLPWLGAALICGWITLRLTGSLILAAAAHLAASLLLVFFRAEPGHPQELTLLLVLALAAAPLLAGIENRWTLLMLALGALSAALLMVKVNAGAFAVAAVVMTLLSCGPRNRAGLLQAWAAGAACTVLPAVLMRNHLGAEWARSYCGLEVASTAGCVCCLLRMRRGPQAGWRDGMLAAAGFAATLSAIMAVLLAGGVSMPAVYRSLVVVPSRVFLTHPNWFLPPQLGMTLPWLLVGLGAAILVAWRLPLPETPAWRALFAGKTVFAAVALVTILFHRRLPTVVTPFVWLLLFEPNSTDRDTLSFARRLLSILTVLQTLYAYPVAGSQFSFIQILLSITVLVCVGDSLSWLTQSRRTRQERTRWGRTSATAALTVVALVQVGVGVDQYRKYRSLPSMDLPGARLLHVEPGTKARFHWLVRNLKEQCDSFESLPGLPSLNFWTEIEPLTGLNIDAWTLCLSVEEQRIIIAALSRHPRACIVYHPGLAAFWNPAGEDLESLPLVQHIRQEFKLAMASGEYQLLIRTAR